MNPFTVSTGLNDIEAVMDAVADALRRWEGGGELSLDLSPVSGKDERLGLQAHRLKLQYNIDSNAVIHSTRPGLGPWIIRFQTLVRRLTWWFLEPVVQQIRLFQMNTARVVDGLAKNQELLASQVAKIEDLVQRVEALEMQGELLQRGPVDLDGEEDLA
jgi:hypothetical protein